MIGGCAGLAGLAMLTLVFGLDRQPGLQGAGVVLVACAPIVLLRRWPLLLLGLATVTASLEIAWGVASLPAGVLLGLSCYFTSSRLPRPTSIRAGVVAVTALGGGLLWSILSSRVTAPGAEALECFLPLATGWFIGDSTAARRRYLAGLAEQAEKERLGELERTRREVREERVRIARELHDVVAHTLAVMTVQAGVAQRLLDQRPEGVRTALASIEAVGRTAQDELEVVLALLRDARESPSLVPSPRLFDLKQLVDTVRAAGTEVELRASGMERTLSPALELSIYRVVQEALTNVVKHASGARAAVDLDVSEDSVRLEIINDSHPGSERRGRDGSSRGHGIIGMRERLSAFGGSLLAEPLTDGGFRVVGSVPFGRSS